MPTEPSTPWWTWLSEAWHAGGTGGLNWHLHAHQSRQRWQPTVQALSAYLEGIHPQRRHLLLIGASAGWMMSSAWLQGFRKIVAYDIDPLAAPLFRWRHGQALRDSQTQLIWVRGDALNQLDAVLKSKLGHIKWVVWVQFWHTVGIGCDAGIARGHNQVILGGACAQKRLNNCVLAGARAQN